MADKRMAPAAAAAAALTLTMAAWMTHEGTGPVTVDEQGRELMHPYIPVKADRPTIGYGATYYEDGRPVTLQDAPITRERAATLALHHVGGVYGRCVVQSLGDTPMLPAEVSVAIDHAGQYGCAAWRASPMLRAYLRRDYAAACRGYLSYRFITSNNKEGAGWRAYQAAGRTRYKYDCATPGNRVCRGVWLRSQERHSQCLAALEGA